MFINPFCRLLPFSHSPRSNLQKLFKNLKLPADYTEFGLHSLQQDITANTTLFAHFIASTGNDNSRSMNGKEVIELSSEIILITDNEEEIVKGSKYQEAIEISDSEEDKFYRFASSDPIKISEVIEISDSETDSIDPFYENCDYFEKVEDCFQLNNKESSEMNSSPMLEDKENFNNLIPIVNELNESVSLKGEPTNKRSNFECTTISETKTSTHPDFDLHAIKEIFETLLCGSSAQFKSYQPENTKLRAGNMFLSEEFFEFEDFDWDSEDEEEVVSTVRQNSSLLMRAGYYEAALRVIASAPDETEHSKQR